MPWLNKKEKERSRLKTVGSEEKNHSNQWTLKTNRKIPNRKKEKYL